MKEETAERIAKALESMAQDVCLLVNGGTINPETKEFTDMNCEENLFRYIKDISETIGHWERKS